MDWQSIANAKNANLLALIPPQWILRPSDIPSSTDLRDVTGYTSRFLSPRELEITNATSIKILSSVRSGDWPSVEITRAFCHRAAIAHQLVRERSDVLDDSYMAASGTDR